MKFYSTFQNYRIILKPGISGNRNLGTQSIPAVSVRFEGGVVDVKDEEIISMMMNHPSFKKDFFPEEKTDIDPFEYKRRNTEPQHTIVDVEYGRAKEAKNAGVAMSPDKKKAFDNLVRTEALKLVQKMLEESKVNESKEVSTEGIIDPKVTTPENTETKELPSIISEKLTAPEPIEADEEYPSEPLGDDESILVPDVPSEEVVEASVSEAINIIIPTEEPKAKTKQKIKSAS